MKRLSTLSLLVLVLSIVGCAPAATPSPTAIPPAPTEPPPTAAPTTAPPEETSPWEQVVSVEVAYPFRAAAFLDETFGLIMGRDDNAIRYTTDGGQTWVAPTTVGNTRCHFGVDIVDTQVAWSCGGTIPATFSADGGQTWTLRSHPIDNYCMRQCRFLSFLDETTGWVASQYALAATNDGGETWTEITLPEGVGDDVLVAALALRTANDAYLLDTAGALHITQDGGQNWSSQALLDIGSRTLHSAAVRFSDADHGVVFIALLGGGQNELLEMRTSDGGQTWEQEVMPTEPGAVYLTHDGTVLTVTSLFGDQVTVLRHRGD